MTRSLRTGCYLFVIAILSACSSSDSQTSIDTAEGPGSEVPATPEPPATPDSPASQEPNILFIIADDQGLDASSQYSVSQDLPNTPIIDGLAQNGLIFDNAWATPSCTTTRGSLITGLHGVNSGVDTVPNLMDPNILTLQSLLGDRNGLPGYSSAVIGKWHLAGADAASDPDLQLHPNNSGVDYYAGNISGVIDDYFEWPLTVNGSTTTSTEYHTTAVTDLAIDWTQDQSDPWFLWLAYVSPHSPFHLPPADLHTRTLSGEASDIQSNPRDYYLAAIEAMDTEIGRLLASMSADTRDNTLIVYLGDNGTPQRVIDTAAYLRTHGKGTLYEGGIRIPMIASGAGVSRVNERETALVNTVDLLSTIADATGTTIPTGLDSHSFFSLLDANGNSTREYNYSEFVDNSVTGWTVRDATLKLIEYADGTRELYNLSDDPREESNLIDQAANFGSEITALENFANQVRTDSVETDTQGGAADITNAILENQSANCAQYVSNSTSTVSDVFNTTVFNGSLQISTDANSCSFSTNAIPNHDFNDGSQSFPNNVSEQVDVYTISATPVKAAAVTELALTRDNAILLNGVKVDLLAAACFGVGDEKTGCNDPAQAWRFDPMFDTNGFRVDSHNAHTQPDGTYHYHGLPNALFSDDTTTLSPVVGFAADGFPIYGSNIQDVSEIRPATSSYRLKTGARPSGQGQPGGSYDGTFRDDYEYVAGLGDLDECNGMSVDGTYRYHMTNAFPHIIGCFAGTPDDSFLKRN